MSKRQAAQVEVPDSDVKASKTVKPNLKTQVLALNPKVNRLVHPFKMMICGPSMSGKSKFILQLLKHRKEMFTSGFHQIYYCLPPESQQSSSDYLEEIKSYVPDVNIIYGLPKSNHVFDNMRLPKLFVIDDQMTEIGLDPFLQNMFTRSVNAA